jgi:hypothetical protein
MGADDREGYDATVERLKERLGETALAELQAEGRALSLEQAVAVAAEKR